MGRSILAAVAVGGVGLIFERRDQIGTVQIDTASRGLVKQVCAVVACVPFPCRRREVVVNDLRLFLFVLYPS